MNPLDIYLHSGLIMIKPGLINIDDVGQWKQ